MDAQSVLGDLGIPLNDQITVVVPTANQVSCLDPLLSSIQMLEGPLPETIVVPNGVVRNKHADDQLIQKFDRMDLRIVYDDVPGQLSGRHRGIQESDAPILVFVDDDVEVSKTWLSSIHDAFQDPEVMLVGGPCIPRFETEPPDWLAKFWQPQLGHGRMLPALSLLELDFAQPTSVDPTMIWGLNFAIRRSTLQSCGGFHPDCVPADLQHFQGDGETGLCLKIAAANHKSIYHPRASVHHRVAKQRMTWDYFDQRYFYQGVCDSFTQIRSCVPPATDSRNVTFPSTVRDLVSRLKRTIIGPSTVNPLQQRFAGAYQRGFKFHQQCVSRSSILHQWVLRENYFDYQYPTLESDFVRPKRQVHPS